MIYLLVSELYFTKDMKTSEISLQFTFDLGFFCSADHDRVILGDEDDKDDGPYINAVYVDVRNSLLLYETKITKLFLITL